MKVLWRCREIFADSSRSRSIVRMLCDIFRRSACSLNPFSWGERTIKIVTVLFFCIALPVYLYIGFQPYMPADAASYPSLSISSIGLSVPVEPLELKDRQLNVPDMIVGSYGPNINKTLLVGHSSTVFEELDQLRVDQEINYNDSVYRVTEIKVLRKEEISMTEILSGASVDTIILMTCAGDSLPNQDATHRLIITAEINKS